MAAEQASLSAESDGPDGRRPIAADVIAESLGDIGGAEPALSRKQPFDLSVARNRAI